MLKVDNIHKSYRKQILKGISFNVEEGEIVGIVGANGSGKSTLVSIITGNIKSDKGCITIDENNILDKSFDLSKYIGYVPQENSLFNKLTVQENISFWSKAYGVKSNNLYFDKHLLNEKVHKLSEGNKKILSIELALLAEPKYLIMDEPTSALDLVNQQKVMSLINDYKDKGNSVLFITHHINEIKQCDKIMLLQNGLISFFDSPNNIFNTEEQIINLIDGGK